MQAFTGKEERFAGSGGPQSLQLLGVLEPPPRRKDHRGTAGGVENHVSRTYLFSAWWESLGQRILKRPLAGLCSDAFHLFCGWQMS